MVYTLAPFEVHLWIIPLIQPELVYQSLFKILSEKEKENVQKILIKEPYIVSHGALREILSLYLRLPSQEIAFQYSKFQKPYLKEPLKNIEFNLSHSGEMALLGLTTFKRIGVDIEKRRPLQDITNLAKTVLTTNEYEYFLNHPAQRDDLFFKYWTAKEAFIKGVGEGLSFGLENVSFRDIDSSNPSISIKTFPMESKEWSIQSFEISPLFSAAIATKQPISTVKRFVWEKCFLA
ncbi:MAG TPA: 4'-phosphopantetheinyl transferase superfamily protein [Alphaproteobacteria bacterium]|nr:4'-phosphopantetheinyl transferase superfamily protein [Alphaproteobacteria bacterium]